MGKKTIDFITSEVINAAADDKESDGFNVTNFKKMLLRVKIVETLNPADATVQIVIRFSDTLAGDYYDLQNGPFGYMIWEEDAIPTTLQVATVGDCVGKFMKVYILGAGANLDGTNYFTVSVSAEFSD